MQIEKLDHVNLRTTQLDVLIDWYSDILGMVAGDRPPFQFPGAWMYVGDSAVVHMVAIEGSPASGSETRLKLEHFAFAARNRCAFEAKLQHRAITFRRVEIPTFNTIQVNLWDPDGNHIHVDFPADEDSPPD
jgi:catechol 2,3-dioxygenase-like lactoylglutathione lyase family enzyme